MTAATRTVYTPNIETLRQLEADHYLTGRTHHRLPLTIWNYTPKVQYSGFWTPDTRACRGLVTDESGKVIARPFQKFFNVEEHHIDDLVGPWRAYEKFDGTLGIAFNYDDQWIMATRGSFVSEQAERGGQMLQHYMGQMDHGGLDPNFTYLYEILYPENRIVVDYDGEEKLVLLGMIHAQKDWEGPAEYSAWSLTYGFPVARCVAEGEDMEFLDKLPEKSNAEGYVIDYYDTIGRVKMKFETYKRLHRLVTGISTKRLWEMLKENQKPETDLPGFPLMSEGYQRWVRSQVSALRSAYMEIHEEIMREWANIVKHVGEPWLEGNNTRDHRRIFAMHAKNYTYANALFLLYDGIGYDEYVWKLVKPQKAEVYKVIDLE